MSSSGTCDASCWNEAPEPHCWECGAPTTSWDQHYCASCTAHWERLKAAQAEYEQQYPNYCRSCGGTGFHVTPPVFYYKDGSGDPGGIDPCGCLESDHCPRCGAEHTIDFNDDLGEYSACAACGWAEGDDGIPEW